MKLLILFASILFTTFGYSQTITDSARTRNDKPGTPQSLRTPDQSPQSHTIIITGNGNKTVVGGSESNTVNNTSGQTIVTPQGNNSVPKTPNTLQTTPVNPADSLHNGANKKVSNVSNPIRN